MGQHYDSDAIELCKRLYLKFSGQQHDRIEKEMQRAGYTGWRKENLYNRGKSEGSGFREGWIDKYGFKAALKIYLAQKPTAALNNAQKLVREIEWIRGQLDSEIRTKGVTGVDIKLVYLHRDYCKLCIDALTRVEAARDTLGGFVSFYERFIDWMTDIDGKLARQLLKVEDLVIARAEKEFDETEETLEYVRTADLQDGDTNPGNAAAESGAKV